MTEWYRDMTDVFVKTYPTPKQTANSFRSKWLNFANLHNNFTIRIAMKYGQVIIYQRAWRFKKQKRNYFIIKLLMSNIYRSLYVHETSLWSQLLADCLKATKRINKSFRLFLKIRGQFHLHFMSSFYARRAQKPKKDSQLKQLFLLLGSAGVRAARKHVDEIDPCFPIHCHCLRS